MHNGLVYILQTPYGIKVGKTKHIEKRIHDLAKNYDVFFIHAIGTHDMSSLERALHLKFASKRVNGAPSREIFALTANDVVWMQSIQRFQGRPCKHFGSLTDAIRHSLAVARRYQIHGDEFAQGL